MTHKTISFQFMYILAALLFVSCPSPVSKSGESSDEEEETGGILFESFYLAPQNNNDLDETVIGEINEDSILLVVPVSSESAWFIPSFNTNAEKVSVNGQDQISGVSSVDFNNPVEYTLTSESGEVKVYTVDVLYTGQWDHMEGSPVGTGTLPAIGFMHGLFPDLIYLDSGMGQLRSLYFNAFASPFWLPFSGTGHFGTANIQSFSSLNADGPVWSVYVNDTLPDAIQLYKYDSVSGWIDAAPMPLALSGPFRSLDVFSGNYDSVFISVINNSDNLKRAELWFFNGNWSQLGGGALSDFKATSLCAAELDNGIWAAAGFEEYPENLYLYHYDYYTGSWSFETAALSSYLVNRLFQNDETRAPILAARCPNADDSSQTDINWLSWDEENRVFGDFVPPLTLSIALTDPVDVEFFDNTPLVITSGSVYEYLQGDWRELGGGPYSDTPALSFSVAAGEHGYHFVSYEDSETSEIRVKMVTVE